MDVDPGSDLVFSGDQETTGVFIQNDSPQAMFLSIDSTAVVGEGIELVAEGGSTFFGFAAGLPLNAGPGIRSFGIYEAHSGAFTRRALIQEIRQ